MSETNAKQITRVINDCCGDPADCSDYEKGTCPASGDSEKQRVDTKAMEQIRTLWDL